MLRLSLITGLLLASFSAPCLAVTGTVSAVDITAGIISLKSGNKILQMDLSNPSLRGYRSLESIRKGDRVDVAYTANGVRIARLAATAGTGSAAAVREPAASSPQAKKKTKVARVRARGTEFDDIDENKDGRISPIELSVAVKNLTVEKFREYDRNGNGFIDRNEYSSIPR